MKSSAVKFFKLTFSIILFQFLDSPSDTSRGPQRRRRARQRVPRRDSSDTESEPEELRSLLERSLSQLREVESLFSNVGLIVNYVSTYEQSV